MRERRNASQMIPMDIPLSELETSHKMQWINSGPVIGQYRHTVSAQLLVAALAERCDDGAGYDTGESRGREKDGP